MVGERLNDSYKGAAFRKDDTELLEEFNTAFASMLEDGSYAALCEKWFGIYIGPEAE
jgi:ABC-type amino acid transport substrate-binding protein